MTEAQRDKRRARWRRYYFSHRDQLIQRNRDYRRAHPDKSAAQARAFMAANKERLQVERAAYRVANREITREKAKAKRLANREAMRASDKSYREANPEQIKTTKARYRTANEQKEIAYRKEHYARNKSKAALKYRKWARANPGKCTAIVMRRFAAKRHATPPWSETDAIERVYIEAARLTKTTGIKHEVDHIYPLQGKTVCGLHVLQNLQILTKSDNVRKYNRMPNSQGPPGQFQTQEPSVAPVPQISVLTPETPEMQAALASA